MRLYTIHAQHGYSCTYPQHWSACPMPLMDNQPATNENAASNSDGDMWRCNPHVLRLQKSHPSCLNSKFFLVKSNVRFNMLKTPWLRGEFSGFPMVRAEKNAQWVVRTFGSGARAMARAGEGANMADASGGPRLEVSWDKNRWVSWVVPS